MKYFAQKLYNMLEKRYWDTPDHFGETGILFPWCYHVIQNSEQKTVIIFNVLQYEHISMTDRIRKK